MSPPPTPTECSHAPTPPAWHSSPKPLVVRIPPHPPGLPAVFPSPVRRGDDLAPGVTLISVMRIDIENFTAKADRYPLSQISVALNTYFEQVTYVIYDWGGDIDKFLGDGCLAFFPAADEAVQAGQAIQEAVATFNRAQEERQSVTFPTRIGIDTGIVAIVSLGSPTRRERTAIGKPVNLADRLQARATPGRVWLTQTSFEQLSTHSGYRCLGPMRLKGLQEPVVVYEA